ncbi:MAG TPA: 2-amino-4-hydroxy-6-hydroxymethyldihydropteridine diphosphokinase [Burkholderiaceae bacterium]|nr:2-amino-4-hydroxy-6-hydroxymethyldihydropteridine diphosphokinase [Burkholderiaceae bacterium]
MMRRAYIGLGSNQGARHEALDAAVQALQELERSQFVAQSPRYQSEPIDAPGPEYLNAVACIDTELDPYSLLLHLLDIEMMLGRKRRGSKRNDPRSVDLDLLLLDDLVMYSTALTLPHPRMHLRAFVLKPLQDLAPTLEIPGQGTVQELMEHVADQRIELAHTPPDGEQASAPNADFDSDADDDASADATPSRT